MCGICGIVSFSEKKYSPIMLNEMNNLIRHRGPDDEGYFIYNNEEKIALSCSGKDSVIEIQRSLPSIENGFNFDIGLGFRRLSILDLSAAAHQPMLDKEKRFVIVFNGEIYNYQEIRGELESKGITFRSNCDTEVILEAYKTWGRDCVKRFNGMWSFVIFDVREQKFFISRDRFGIKPLYYIYKPGVFFAFASEIKPLLQLSERRLSRNRTASFLYFSNSIYQDKTFYTDIYELPRGHNAELVKNKLQLWQYYDIELKRKAHRNEKEDTEEFKELLFNAIKLRHISDVGVGYALSGGIDSSSITCSSTVLFPEREHKTFSLVFPDEDFYESIYVDAVSGKYKLDSFKTTPVFSDLMEDFRRFMNTMEEPVTGLSYYGEFKLRQLIRENRITVSLDGQGADEIIGGYKSLFIYKLLDDINEIKIGKFIQEYSQIRDIYNISIIKIMKNYVKRLLIDQKKGKILNNKYLNDDYFKDCSLTSGNKFKMKSGLLNSELANMLFFSSIPDQLSRADKSAMASSVECRFPFLDHKLVEFSLNLPAERKIQGVTSKVILRKAMKGIVPDSVLARKDKVGFATPQHKWIKSFYFEVKHNYELKKYFNELRFLDVDKFLKDIEIYLLSDSVNLPFDYFIWKIFNIAEWCKSHKVTMT
ncbi:MAG: asparagine synthase (glutamine-hydrolyzing) [Saprospiraceae bacterium]|nr:asparagine synthase (glutamine-hydrolyzing) [Saprospiraceae bacterium]